MDENLLVKSWVDTEKFLHRMLEMSERLGGEKVNRVDVGDSKSHEAMGFVGDELSHLLGN